jgi:BASS family bile acid:Na+ symporter
MNIVTDVILPLALAFIMFVLGLGLTGDDFLRVIKQPRDFFVGAFSQIILLPIIAFVLVMVWPMVSYSISSDFHLVPPELAIGVLIIAAAPGGVTSNLLTSFAKGDVALSISLTAIISLLCVVTIPFILLTSGELLGFGSIINQDISLFSLSRDMFLIVTVPVILGMLLRRFASGVALKFEPIAKKVSIVLFVIVLLGAIAAERENVISYFAQAGLITLILNVVMMVVAYYVAKFLASGTKQKICITIECGLQNGTLAIFVATSIFGGGLYVIPAATYSLIMFATSLIFVFLVRKI